MFGRIVLYLLLAMMIADVYIFILLIRKKIHRWTLRLLWFVPSLLLAGIWLYHPEGRADTVFTITVLAVALSKVLFTAVSLPDLLFRYFFRWKIYPFTALGLLAAVTVCFMVVYGGTAGPTHFAMKEIEFASTDLPPVFDGYRIVHVSDIHLQGWANHRNAIEKFAAMINRAQPDAVMITGDLVHHRATELDGFETVLSSIRAPDGVYSVLGNHDYGSYRRWESEEARMQNLQDLKQRQAGLGWRLLCNEHVFLNKGGEHIALIGVENSGAPPFPDYGNLRKAMSGTGGSTFQILLSHDPAHWRREVLTAGIDLTLSGHTHAGQFALGGFSFSSFLYPEWRGMYREGNQGLYINAGTGCVFLRFRFGAWPEITVITLKRK